MLCGISVDQCPVSRAATTRPRKIAATPAAIAHAGIRLLRPAIERCSAPSAGQDVTQRMQPVHSAELMVISLSTCRADGHALAHFSQSMQSVTSRLIRNGLSFENKPN